jgi:hypothetical protein
MFNLHFLRISNSPVLSNLWLHNCSQNCCHFLSHSRDVSYVSATACEMLSLFPCKLSEHNLPLCILSCFNGSYQHVHSFVRFLHPIPFGRSIVRIILTTVTSIMQFAWPTMFFAWGTVLIAKSYLFRLFGDAGVNRLHLLLTFSPFWFNHAGRLSLHFYIVLNLLKNQ